MTTLQTAGAAMDSADALKELIARQAVEIERKHALLLRALGTLKNMARLANVDHFENSTIAAITKELT